MKNFLMLLVIIWFLFGITAAHDRGFFEPDYTRTCSHVGAAALTVVGGPLYYAGLRLNAAC